jgi:hypothetical protein
LELSNNRAENAIRPFVVGRKNWLFCNSVKGAKASSVVYSIIESAKANGLKPFDYLQFLLMTVPNTIVEANRKREPRHPRKRKTLVYANAICA